MDDAIPERAKELLAGFDMNTPTAEMVRRGQREAPSARATRRRSPSRSGRPSRHRRVGRVSRYAVPGTGMDRRHREEKRWGMDQLKSEHANVSAAKRTDVHVKHRRGDRRSRRAGGDGSFVEARRRRGRRHRRARGRGVRAPERLRRHRLRAARHPQRRIDQLEPQGVPVRGRHALAHGSSPKTLNAVSERDRRARCGECRYACATPSSPTKFEEDRLPIPRRLSTASRKRPARRRAQEAPRYGASSRSVRAFMKVEHAHLRPQGREGGPCHGRAWGKCFAMLPGRPARHAYA